MATRTISKPHLSAEQFGDLASDIDPAIVRMHRDQSPVGVFWNDASGKCVFVNETLCQLIAAQKEDLLGDGWMTFLHQGDRLRLFDEWRTALEAREAFVSEYRFESSRNGVVWVQGRAVPCYDEQGDFRGYIGALIDITQRKKAEQDLQTKLEFEELISQLSTDFVAVEPRDLDALIVDWLKIILDFTATDRAGVFQFSADGASASLEYEQCRETVEHGLDPARFATWHPLEKMEMQWLWTEMIAGRDVVISALSQMPEAAQRDREILEAQQTRSSISVPMQVAGKNIGVFYLDAVLTEHQWSPSFVRQIRMVARIIGTAMQRRQTAAQFAEQELLLAHVSRLSMMGEMLAEISHELTQPLFAIGNFAVAIDVKLNEVDPEMSSSLGLVRKWRASIVEAQQHASAIVSNIAQFSQRCESSRALHGVNDLIMQSIELTSFHARLHKAEVSVCLMKDLPKVVVNPGQIRQVIMNLLTNAFEAMAEIKASDRIATVTTEMAETGERITIIVADNGPGFPTEIVSSLKPFTTTKADGLGLGLAISRRIVTGHAGEFVVLRRTPRGAEIRISLPIHAPTQNGSPPFLVEQRNQP